MRAQDRPFDGAQDRPSRIRGKEVAWLQAETVSGPVSYGMRGWGETGNGS